MFPQYLDSLVSLVRLSSVCDLCDLFMPNPVSPAPYIEPLSSPSLHDHESPQFQKTPACFPKQIEAAKVMIMKLVCAIHAKLFLTGGYCSSAADTACEQLRSSNSSSSSSAPLTRCLSRLGLKGDGAVISLLSGSLRRRRTRSGKIGVEVKRVVAMAAIYVNNWRTTWRQWRQLEAAAMAAVCESAATFLYWRHFENLDGGSFCGGSVT
ncbi:hypothetical protein R3P38DRAFT_2813809 [Favolaschia claudopus]|uniref:Uncharacterized protein n=1 Tax=Favolaschia claudopus TaxID=2862362 RepID=A0AAV9Z520_9AGAR